MESFMTVSEQTLKDMYLDLHDFISQFIKERKLHAREITIRNTILTDEDYQNYNTLIEVTKPFGLGYKMFVNLDNTYDKQDICNLANKYVRYLDTSMKKDAFQLGTISLTIREKYPKMVPGNIFQLALKEFKRLRKEQGEEE